MSCFNCEEKLHSQRTIKLCIDCIVSFLKEANVLNRSESFFSSSSPVNGKKKCEYCLEDVIHSARKTSVCPDCIVRSLCIHSILKHTSNMKLTVRKVNPVGENPGIFFDKHQQNYKQICDMCYKKVIHPKRESKVCIDCIVQSVIDKGIFEIIKAETFKLT